MQPRHRYWLRGTPVADLRCGTLGIHDRLVPVVIGSGRCGLPTETYSENPTAWRKETPLELAVVRTPLAETSALTNRQQCREWLAGSRSFSVRAETASSPVAGTIALIGSTSRRGRSVWRPTATSRGGGASRSRASRRVKSDVVV